MKKLTLTLVICLAFACISVYADGLNLENLKASHMVAMKYHGRVVQERGESPMILMATKDGAASVFIGKDFASAYTEKNDRKIYWEIEKIEDGIKITFFVNILGQVFQKSIIIKLKGGEINIIPQGFEQNRGCNYFKCAALILSCNVCLSNPISSECMSCLGSAYDECIQCF